MQNARQNEVQAGIKTARRNINNFRYTDTLPLWQDLKRNKEPPEERERGEQKCWLKTQHSKNEDYGIGPIISWQIDGGNIGNNDRLYFLGLQNH